MKEESVEEKGTGLDSDPQTSERRHYYDIMKRVIEGGVGHREKSGVSSQTLQREDNLTIF